jgi:hypothetical protein
MALPSASTPWLVDLTAVLSDVRLWHQTDSLANFAQARC